MINLYINQNNKIKIVFLLPPVNNHTQIKQNNKVIGKKKKFKSLDLKRFQTEKQQKPTFHELRSNKNQYDSKVKTKLTT